jgi:hypothetical protein
MEVIMFWFTSELLGDHGNRSWQVFSALLEFAKVPREYHDAVILIGGPQGWSNNLTKMQCLKRIEEAYAIARENEYIKKY